MYREFLPNEEVAKMLASHAPNWDSAINAVIDAANKKWRQEEEVVDDITWFACIVFVLFVVSAVHFSLVSLCAASWWDFTKILPKWPLNNSAGFPLFVMNVRADLVW
jgi:hypothetical protein